MSDTLRGKIAVVVGGSGGIGAATCEKLAQAGATVVVGYRSRRETAEALVKSLSGTGHTALPICVTDTASITAFHAAAVSRFGRTDILVNAAGTTTPVGHKDLDGLTDEIIDEVFASNWRGVFATIRAFAPLLKTSGQGVIINVSSIAAYKGFGSSIAYCGAKAALDSMTHTLALALAPEIRVLSVSPGMVATNFVPGRTEAEIAKAGAATPLGLVAQPSHVADTIYAAIAHMPLSTGIRIAVDAGRGL
ncbi:SDR family NAD(P)-dependent oxidoreductase [Puniceibacterium sediminis]|uniref:3-oxoacyl-[acyl-carrier protein] reductase n=1 Tax=Puniceibacterium sediminis TaxID=1608407 RepID=A0A238X2N6_9RHOB|nr:SDR family oxidoreductase [Puniceibacterium sediminis]SNR53206.1 3-oxoacyl-[acyl-carrier protein] reductase [Puniceibacterium sediminis]